MFWIIIDQIENIDNSFVFKEKLLLISRRINHYNYGHTATRDQQTPDQNLQ